MCARVCVFKVSSDCLSEYGTACNVCVCVVVLVVGGFIRTYFQFVCSDFKDRQTDRQTDRQADRQTDTHAGSQAGRQLGRQTGRQI